MFNLKDKKGLSHSRRWRPSLSWRDKWGTKLDPDKEIQSRLLFMVTANLHS